MYHQISVHDPLPLPPLLVQRRGPRLVLMTNVHHQLFHPQVALFLQLPLVVKRFLQTRQTPRIWHPRPRPRPLSIIFLLLKS